MSVKTLLFVTVFLLVGCKASDHFSGSEAVTVKGLRKSYRKSVAFTIVNTSTEKQQLESTQRLYIERFENERWEQIPFIPCKCGTPCRPPALADVLPGQSVAIAWNLVARKCGNEASVMPPVKTFEQKVSGGLYRMIFTVNRQENGMRLPSEQLVVAFEVKD